MQSNDQVEADQPSLLRRLQSDLERIKQVASYVGAIVTIFQTALHWEDTVNLVSEHIVTAFVCLGGLVLLFSSTLFQNIKLKFPQLNWRRSAKQSESLPATPSQSDVRQIPKSKRLLLMIGSLVLALALGTVTFLLYVSFTGIHFVMIESAGSYEQAVRRAAEINRALKNSGESSLRASAHHSWGANPYCAILVGGPYFSRDAAEETLRRLRNIPNFRVRPDAVVLSYSISNDWQRWLFPKK